MPTVEQCKQIARDDMWNEASNAPWPTRHAFIDISRERVNQDKKWGGVKHDDHHNAHDWIAYLIKHTGKAVAEPWHVASFRIAMVKVGAIAVAAIEWCDRKIGRY